MKYLSLRRAFMAFAFLCAILGGGLALSPIRIWAQAGGCHAANGFWRDQFGNLCVVIGVTQSLLTQPVGAAPDGPATFAVQATPLDETGIGGGLNEPALCVQKMTGPTNIGNHLCVDGANVIWAPASYFASGVANVPQQEAFVWGMTYGTAGIGIIGSGDDDSSGLPFTGFTAQYFDVAPAPTAPFATQIGCDKSTFDCGFRGAIEATSDGNVAHVSWIPPSYKHDGTKQTKTVHCVDDKVTAGGASTAVTLTAPAAFADHYTLDVDDDTTPAVVTTFATKTLTGFSFTSTNLHVYSYRACGV